MGHHHMTAYQMYFAVIDSKKFMEIFVDWTKEIVKKKTDKI